MKPSFFALFKRGKYFHPPRPGQLPSDSERLDEKPDREVNETERFAAAAIAFCFKHDARFKRHFLKSVCATTRCRGAYVEVEPTDWADLLVSYPDQIYAVELKISAPLQPHQDPLGPKWKDGYGSFLKEQIKEGRRVGYVVLSRRQKSGVKRNGVQDGVPWCHKLWFDMAKDFPQTPLARDLAQSLEALGVPPLLIERTNKMKMNRRITEFAKTGRVLYDTAAKLGLSQDYCHLDVHYAPKTASAHVGIDVRRATAKRTTNNHELFAKKVIPPKKSCGWFGYVDEGANGFEMGVWFYCGKRKVAEGIRDKLQSSNLPVVECKRDKTVKATEWWNVVVRTRKHRKASDRDWFVSVFEAIGIEPVI